MTDNELNRILRELPAVHELAEVVAGEVQNGTPAGGRPVEASLRRRGQKYSKAGYLYHRISLKNWQLLNCARLPLPA